MRDIYHLPFYFLFFPTILSTLSFFSIILNSRLVSLLFSFLYILSLFLVSLFLLYYVLIFFHRPLDVYLTRYPKPRPLSYTLS